MNRQIILSLGTNQGGKKGNLLRAIQSLDEILQVEKISSIYETSPVGDLDQDDFLNLCLSGQSGLLPLEFLHRSQGMEATLGRVKTSPKGPRLIDIDLIFFGEMVMNEEKLTLPHLSFRTRLFVLVPLLEIAPDAMDPVFGVPIRNYLRRSFSGQRVKNIGKLIV